MLSTTYTLGTVPKSPELGGLEDIPGINWDQYLSIDMIRQHTKTDDIPSVTDDQLRLYRAAAIESAERFTGLCLTKQKVITEIVQMPRLRPGKEYFTYRLQYSSVDGIVYVYGTNPPDQIHLPPNSRTVKIHTRFYTLDLSNCCDPCWQRNGGIRVMYRSGFACADQVPAGVLLGILQYIAWIVEHPGDEVLSVRNTLSTRGDAIVGTNNVALVSGALETWRQYDPEAV